MWNTSISLPETDTITQDTSGFPSHNKTYISEIPATRLDVTRADEQLANQYGYTVSHVYEIDKACYNNAGFLIDEADGEIYDIKRTYSPDKSNNISLTVEKRNRGKR